MYKAILKVLHNAKNFRSLFWVTVLLTIQDICIIWFSFFRDKGNSITFLKITKDRKFNILVESSRPEVTPNIYRIGLRVCYMVWEASFSQPTDRRLWIRSRRKDVC